MEKQSFDETVLRKPPWGVGFHQLNSGFRITASMLSTYPFTFFLGSLLGFLLYGSMKEYYNIIIATYLFVLSMAMAIAVAWIFLSIFGDVVVSIDGKNSYVFVGIGRLGFTQKFKWDAVTKIREYLNKDDEKTIQIEAERTITFGRLLNNKRRKFIIEALKYAKAKRV